MSEDDGKLRRQGIFGDLRDPRLMYLKAILFLAAGLLCAAGLLVQEPSLTNVFLLIVAIWSFCRLYYFFFYVIERYVDPSYRFGGIGPALLHLARHRRRHSSQPAPHD